MSKLDSKWKEKNILSIKEWVRGDYKVKQVIYTSK